MACRAAQPPSLSFPGRRTSTAAVRLARMSGASARIGACRSSPATPESELPDSTRTGSAMDSPRSLPPPSDSERYRPKTSPQRSGCSALASPVRPLPTSTPPSNRARSCDRGRSAAPCTCCPRRCSGPSSRSPVPASEAVICWGPIEARGQRLVLLDEWAPGPAGSTARSDREATLATLFLAYVRGHGPVTVRDFAWWSGLTLTDARVAHVAVGDAVAAFDAERYVATDSGWPADPSAAAPRAAGKLALAAFDEYFLGYTDRTAVCDP